MQSNLLLSLRSDLERAGYRDDAVASLLGEVANAARLRGVFAAAHETLAARPASPLATLVRLFLLGDPVADTDLEVALPHLGAEGARQLELIDEDGRALLSLNPVRVTDSIAEDAQHWWIISDLDDQLRRGPARPDHVMGVGGATRSLIAQAPVTSATRSLDLGTGCGIVALHLALRGPVVATDISERALVFARANAELNGVSEHIEFRSGSLFAPVAGEQFDLILSNPPFVITPRTDEAPVYEYRDGGMTGDELAEQVVRDAPAHLTPGGSLLCLANWESPWGTNGLERVRGWVTEASRTAQASLTAWVVERDRVTPEQYAETWARDGGARPGDDAFDRLMLAWLRDFAARRITAIGLGSIRLRREAEAVRESNGDLSNTVHVEQAMGAFAQEELGRYLSEAFDVGARAARMTVSEVLHEHWVVDPAVSEQRTHRPGEEAPSAIMLVTEKPIARRVTADTLLAAAVGVCDGDLSLAQIADALAAILEIDPGAAAEALVDGVRELAWLGMIAPAGR